MGLALSRTRRAGHVRWHRVRGQPTEIGWTREAIRAQIGGRSYPQLVLRLGTVIQNAVSLRRPLSGVVVQT